MGVDLDRSGGYHNRTEPHEHTGNEPTAYLEGIQASKIQPNLGNNICKDHTSDYMLTDRLG
jgi:hypothetical protein